MFENIKEYWEKNGFMILCIISILIIFVLGIYNKISKKKGSYSNDFIYYKIKKYKPQQLRVKKDSKGEIECRRVLEKIFNKPFNKIRPNFLRNTVTGNYNLELDCYNDDLKLAVEYNGIQHYKYVPYFHKSKESFQNQQYRDYMKRNICKENGIYLIEVPYTIKIDDIEDYIDDEKKEILKNEARPIF